MVPVWINNLLKHWNTKSYLILIVFIIIIIIIIKKDYIENFVIKIISSFYSKSSLISDTPMISKNDIDKYLPEIKVLEDNWKIILDEYSNIKTTSIKGDLFFSSNIIKTNKWKKFYIKWYNDIPHKTRKQIPKLSKILDDLPRIRLAMFSVLKPGTKILPHEGGYKGSLRCHLGLSCPSKEEGCILTLDGKQYGWKNGKCLVWDDTYTHSVVNNSNKDRIILFMDIDRPVKNNFIQKITHYFASFTNRENFIS